MTDTSLEIECQRCGNLFWYSGEKNFPEKVECPRCFRDVEVPEDG